ncbi:hypothetical protein ASG79_22810 [Arthrobacter sp. Soil761]|nr:hypothetical protein ASG79_22810 [Arthrobacter sp. Soil761]
MSPRRTRIVKTPPSTIDPNLMLLLQAVPSLPLPDPAVFSVQPKASSGARRGQGHPFLHDRQVITYASQALWLGRQASVFD